MSVYIFMGRKRTFSYDEEYLIEIDREDKAYWLGFIYAEGNVHKNTLSVKLGQDECDHLEIFRNDIKSTYEIKFGKPRYCRLRIYKSSLEKELLSVGLSPNKSKHIRFPDLREDLIPHFIRGFMDGDGWISIFKRKEGWIEYKIGFSSCSKDFIESIKRYIEDHLGKASGNICVKKYANPKHSNNYQLVFSKKSDVKVIGKWLYSGATRFLPRKKDIFDRML